MVCTKHFKKVSCVDRLTPHKRTLAFIIVLQEHCSVSCRRVLADAGCQHGGRVPLPARRREAGDLGEGGTVVLEAPGQVRERLPGAVSPSPPAAPLLGGGVAGTLGGRGRGSEGDPAEGRLTPLWLWLHGPVVEPGLLRGPLHGPARRQVGRHTGAPVWLPQGRGVLGLSGRHPVLLLHLLLRLPQTHLYLPQRFHRAPVSRVWDGGGRLLCYHLCNG